MVLKLYAYPASPPCRAVHALIDVLRLPVHYIAVHPLNGETRTKEFTEVDYGAVYLLSRLFSRRLFSFYLMWKIHE